MPVQNSWTPLHSRMMQTRLGQPEVGSPNISARTMTKIMPMNASRQNRTPTPAAISSGVVEKPTMPSMEYLNRPQKFHLVVPATRSMFS